MQFFPALTPSACAGVAHKQLDTNAKCLISVEVQEVTEICKVYIRNVVLKIPSFFF